jgi:Flp pilus assembly protein TadG
MIINRHPLARDRRGVAAVEFALVASVLFIMLGGIADYGIALWAKSSLANAVAEGVQYAYLYPTATTSQIQTVVQGSSALSPRVVASVTGPACYCINGTTPTLGTAACSSTCADGSKAGSYVLITATYPYSAFLPGFSGMATSTTLTESATVRVQ